MNEGDKGFYQESKTFTIVLFPVSGQASLCEHRES